jgi:hypothetical protein
VILTLYPSFSLRRCDERHIFVLQLVRKLPP